MVKIYKIGSSARLHNKSAAKHRLVADAGSDAAIKRKNITRRIAATDHGHRVLIDLVDQPVLFGDAPGPAVR